VTQPGDSDRQRHYANIFVGFVGFAVLIFAGVGAYTGIPTGEDIAFAVAAAGLVALSPVAHKIGKFKVTPTKCRVRGRSRACGCRAPSHRGSGG
jgi:hypothetical protein